MSKKKKFKSSNEICDLIEERYLDEDRIEEYTYGKTVIDKLPILVDNNLGCAFEDSEYVGNPSVCTYRLASKFIQKYNPTLKAYRRKLKSYEFGNPQSITSKTNPELVKLSKYVLGDGKYFAELDKKTYAVLIIKTIAASEIETKLYFIGDTFKKWIKKYNKFVDKYKEYESAQRSEVMQFSNGSRAITTRFKPFDQLVFNDKKKVIEYIDNWVESIPTYYNKYKMIPKLSILLYGDPGTGKSTFYRALAKHLGISTVKVLTQEYFYGVMRNPSEDRYGGYYGYRNEPIIYAIDDIDCVCESRNSKNNTRDNASTLSNLLAFLDNPPTFDIKANDGIMYPVSIVVATTNYFDKLDYAVRRYGRFDLSLEMKNFDKKSAQKMCDIYDLKLEDLVKGSNKKNFQITPAKLQALCLENIDNSLKKKKNKMESPFEHVDGRILIHRKESY